MSFVDILTTILPLILVLGLLYAALVFVRKSGFAFGSKQKKYSKIKVVSTQAIMPKKFVSIVKVKDKYLVLGVSENSINLLKEFDSMDEDSDDDPRDTQKFSEVLKNNLGVG